MRKVRKETQAVSIIIGALMLTVIVVSAATSFALFTSQKQKELQEAEYVRLQRELEQLSIENIQQPTYASGELSSIIISLNNLHEKESTITSLRINTQYARHFIIQRTDTSLEEWQVFPTTGALRLGGLYAKDSSGQPYIFHDKDNNKEYSFGETVLDADYNKNGILATPTIGDLGGLYALDSSNRPYIFQDLDGNKEYTSGEPIIDDNPDNQGPAIPSEGDRGKQIYPDYYQTLKIKPRETIKIIFEDIPTDVYYSNPIRETDAITISIYTTLTNEFTKTFYPPTAIIRIITESQWNPTPPGSYDNYLIFDGSSSDHPGTDAYIISWQWDIEGTLYTGRKIHPTPMPSSGNEITLTVTDNFGMTGSTTLIYP